MFTKVIDSWATLPRALEGHVQERVWFDLKATYSPKSHSEMAKDVAAFANAIGGTLIVGASEGATEPDYSCPLSIEYAAALANDFDIAVRDFCRPSPTVHVRTIPVPNAPEKVILTVNVEPIVDQPVAARHAVERDMWRFPHRIGRHTEFILPEQLPLYMNSKARRAKLLLLRVKETGGDIDLFTVPSGLFKRGDIQAPGYFVIEQVDENASGAVVIRDRGNDFNGQFTAIPIDDVEAVWRQHTSRWAMRISGRLEDFIGAGLAYIPPTTFVVSPLEKVALEASKRVGEVAQAIRGTLVVQQHARAEPSQEDISGRAHHLWLQRLERNQPGDAQGDWFSARRQLIAERRND